ncbi:DUF2334 domain-containing protein [Geothrix sp. PMB-07]|uniref:DUF2334 domain-containing protein n=1 Tax=Geothrix sp. PMB-07 TaxID=3068640 RepID=UPI0027406F16|nr:DUF2334 domain-containing protein [Geothrix sp. PMB-07]WLT30170.1 DUF2334 domain-containing protein [Geothrix sp. PMB-07]
MNWKAWEAIEAHLLRYSVRPILAVVPDNRDPKLMVDAPNPAFWDRVRTWQARGYTIALHGFQHVYVNKNPGMIGVTAQSEFAGLSYQEQERKLSSGLAIFAEQGVRADAWVAPSHSFDACTVEILGKLGVSVISDGLGSRPFTDAAGMTWIPQQLWSFQAKSSGVWTVCNHHNSWTDERVEWFGDMLALYSDRITDLPSVVKAFSGLRRPWLDRLQASYSLMWGHRLRPALSKTLRNWTGSRPAAR